MTSKTIFEDKEKAKQLLDDGKQKIKEGYEEEKDRLEQGKHYAQHLYKQAEEIGQDLYEKGKKKLGDAQEYLQSSSKEVSKAVQTNPVTSLLIAGGIGFLLSLLIKK